MTQTVEEFIEHYGTKGMKWGVRKNIQKRSGSERSAWVNAKDAKWVDKVEANPKITKVARIAARDAKRQTKRLKAEYKANGLNVKKNGLDRTRYDNELKTILEQSVARASYKVHKTSPTGLKEVQIHRHPDGSMSATIGTRSNAKLASQQRKIAKADAKAAKAVKHADDDAPTAEDFDGLEFLLVLDNEGFVDDILTPFDDELEQSDDVDEFLAHYGVKGMKWGVRRRSGGSSSKGESAAKPEWAKNASKSKSSAGAAAAEKVKAKRGFMGRKVKERTPKQMSEDAIAFKALKEKAKNQGLDSLTNAEVKRVTDRFQLEQNYKKAFPKKKNPLVGLLVEGVLSEFGEASINSYVGARNPNNAVLLRDALAGGREVRKLVKKK